MFVDRAPSQWGPRRTTKVLAPVGSPVSGYVVAIKRSARLASAEAGSWVNREGPRRSFLTKTHAREWARTLGDPDTTLWIQDAVPADPADVDGYLVAGRRHSSRRAVGTQGAITAGTAGEPAREQ